MKHCARSVLMVLTAAFLASSCTGEIVRTEPHDGQAPPLDGALPDDAASQSDAVTAPSCGDGSCNGSETCGTCPDDCGACPAGCGDGSCDGSETCSCCPDDCGVCPGGCGDGSCDGSETCTSCPDDCGACPSCGDGTCDGSETCSSCPADCGDCTAAFRFIAWADTKSGTSTLTAESVEAKTFNPMFTIYPGDIQNSWDSGSMGTWVDAFNGGADNGMFNITFAARGNHDDDSSGWQAFFDFAAVASSVGATNYTELTLNLTYSFDFGNSHFVAIDVPGDVTLLSSAQLSWVEGDLTAAESRGLTHAFLFFHGPIYPVGGHCCPSLPAFVDLTNRHPIVSATFHGHEHSLAWIHIDSSRYSNATHEFESFVTGGAGAGLYACDSGRSDFCDSTYGFMVVDVSGTSFTVAVYPKGGTTPLFERSFTK